MSVNLKSVLISDPVDECCAALLTSHGVSVTTKYKLSKEDLIKELAKHDGLIVRSETKVTAEVINASPNLRLVGRAGTGVDNIDIPAATRKGVLVLNTPGGNSTSACELTCAMIAALARNLVQAGQSMREGRWERKLFAGHELAGKCLGIVGFGRIGREVARRMRAHGMRVVVFDPSLGAPQAAELGVAKADLEGLWRSADYISVHVPLVPQTEHLINAASLAKCKPGVRIVNVARGGIVDEAALLDSLKAGHCAGAALDVFAEEPPRRPLVRELIQHPRVIATPHLGASTAEAQTRVALEIAEQFLAISGRSDEYAATGVVNAPAMAAAVASPDNAAWIRLARRLGRIAGKFAAREPRPRLEARTCGPDMAGKRFVHAALQLGLLAGRQRNGLNLVNAPGLAREAGVQLDEAHDDGPRNCLLVSAGRHSVQGTVAGRASLLLSIDGQPLGDGVQLQEHVSLYRASEQQELARVVAAHVASGVAVRHLSVAGGWLIVQTDNQASVLVDGLESY